MKENAKLESFHNTVKKQNTPKIAQMQICLSWGLTAPFFLALIFIYLFDR